MSDEQKFYVRVCRPRFEVAAIEVTSIDHQQAQLLATWQSNELPDTAWKLLPFDGDSYFPHVEECVSDHDMAANADPEDPKEAQIEELMSLRRERDERYLLLVGDVFAGEGRVIFQPWCRCQHPQLIEKDLTADWTDSLEKVFMHEAGVSVPWAEPEDEDAE